MVTVFGTQEGAKVGYNPRYRGRRSYKIKVCFISQTGELVNAGLYDGQTHSNKGFLEFFKETVSMIGPRTVVVGVRLDKGFFDEKNFIYFEDNCMEYVCKAKLTSSVRKIIAYLDDQKASMICMTTRLLSPTWRIYPLKKSGAGIINTAP